MAEADTFEELEAHDCWEIMKKGTVMTKLSTHNKVGGKGRKLQRKTFFLDEKNVAIFYKPTKKKHIRYEVAQITDILTGDDLKEDFGELAKKHPLDMCISIEFGQNGSLEMIASSPRIAKVWAFGLKTLIENRNNNERDGALRQRWLIDAFEKFDKNKDGALSLSEVTKLLNALNITMSPKTVKRKFKEADTGNEDASLDKEEFAEFFKSIATRKEIVEIMETSPNQTHMDARDFQTFLEEKQGMKDLTRRYCEEIILEYEPTKEGKDARHLGIDGLTNYLTSREGNLYNVKHDKVYQDMTQPLSHYFIASSHNTYLMMDQLRGPSSVNAYINAFKKGCRCVELDCWDGENGEPIVYHGHTLTSKIKFRDIIEAVKEYAFKVSDYPVILSLENHCNIKNQKAMAAHLENILGDMLYRDPVDDSLSALPSPESLKRKILIKGKKLKPEQENEEDEEEGDVSDEDEAAEIDPDVLASAADSNVDGGEGEGTSAAAAAVTKPQKEKDKKKRSNSLRYSFRAVGKAVRRVKKPLDKENKAKAKVKLAKELSRCVNYFTSVGFKNFELSKKNARFFQMSSFVESKMTSLALNHGAAFVEYNKRQLSRTYPAGNRVDSSNYNPQIGWNAGCQIVALNYQTDGEMMQINQGKFQQNGKAGYVLKPEFMRDPSIDFNPKHPPEGLRKLLKIKVISGQQLPKPEGESSKGEVIDPYVEVKIYGLPSDQGTFKSKVVKDNGFNPIWNLEVEKELHVPELVMIRFAVLDEDVGKDDFIGQFSLPFTSLQTGYRHVHLLNMKGEPIPHATIFVHVTIEDNPKSSKSSKSHSEPKQDYQNNPASPTLS